MICPKIVTTLHLSLSKNLRENLKMPIHIVTVWWKPCTSQKYFFRWMEKNKKNPNFSHMNVQLIFFLKKFVILPFIYSFLYFPYCCFSTYQSIEARSCCCGWPFFRGVGSETSVEHIWDAACRPAYSWRLWLATPLKNLKINRGRSNYHREERASTGGKLKEDTD